jgi:hypothetical protein
MPLYYFVIRNGHNAVASSPSAIDLPDLDVAWEEATMATGEIVKDLDGSLDVGTEWSIQIQDEARTPLRTIRPTSESHE